MMYFSAGLVKIKAKEFNVSEGDGRLKVCAEIVGAHLDLFEPLTIDFELAPGTANCKMYFLLFL